MSARISAVCAPPPLDPDLDLDAPRRKLPPVNDYMASYAKAKPLTEGVQDHRLRQINVQADLAYVNAMAGFTAISPHLGTIRGIPGVDVEAIERVPLLSEAFLGANHELTRLAQPDSELPVRLTRGRQVRKGLLHIAKGAAALGLIPSARVKRIVQGSGSLDTASDLIDLALLFGEFEESCRGKVTVAPEFIAEANEIGTWLRRALRPTGALPKARPDEIREATLIRQRIWTLLCEAYEELQRVATFLRIDVPSLQSRRGMRKKAKTEEGADT